MPPQALTASEFVDPYLDPDTGIMRNLVGARSRAQLDAAETALTFARAVELTESPVPASGDLGEFRAIHRHLFQDFCEWAGEIRTVDIRKDGAGAEFFLPVVMIDRASHFAAVELRDDGMLRGMSRERFVDRLSYHYDQWNYVHPFREGNGRTQRIFWNGVAERAGWNLDWRAVTAEVNVAVARAASEQRDLEPLRKMFDGMVSPATSPAPATDPDRLGLGCLTPADALRIAAADMPTPPTMRSPATPEASVGLPYRPGRDLGPGAGLTR